MKEYITNLLSILAEDKEEYIVENEETNKYITFYKPLTYRNKLAILAEIERCLKSPAAKL